MAFSRGQILLAQSIGQLNEGLPVLSAWRVQISRCLAQLQPGCGHVQVSPHRLHAVRLILHHRGQLRRLHIVAHDEPQLGLAGQCGARHQHQPLRKPRAIGELRRGQQDRQQTGQLVVRGERLARVQEGFGDARGWCRRLPGRRRGIFQPFVQGRGLLHEFAQQRLAVATGDKGTGQGHEQIA